jgi:hypothetical protein
MNLPRRRFLYMAAVCCRPAGRSARRLDSNLSDAANTHHRAHGTRRRARYYRAAHRAMALAAARLAVSSKTVRGDHAGLACCFTVTGSMKEKVDP